MSSSFRSLQGPYNWIDNERVQPVDSVGTFKNLEPRSGKLLAEIPSSGSKEVDRAVKSANEAFKSWSQVLYNVDLNQGSKREPILIPLYKPNKFCRESLKDEQIKIS